jgi:predicted GNAT family N-acyltransferase
MKESEISLKKPYNFLSNGTLTTKQPEELLALGAGVSGLLAKLGGEHTFHPPAEELAFAMATNHAVVATTPEGELAGYVKMSPWVTDMQGQAKMAETPADYEAMQNGSFKPVCVEVGSLVVDMAQQGNNLGKALASQMLDVASASYPDLPKIAVVTNDNVPSLHVFHKLGWPTVAQEHAAELLGIDVLDGWPHPSTIFICNG